MGARGSKSGNNRTRIGSSADSSAGSALQLALRGSRTPATPAAANRVEVASSGNLLVRLEQLLNNPIRSEHSSETLQNAYLLLTELLFRRTGESGLLDALHAVQRQLWAEPCIVDLCSDIVEAFELRRQDQDRLAAAEVLENLRLFVEWLRKRLRSMTRLGAEELEEVEGAPGDVHVFDLQLNREAQWFDYPGLGLSLGIKLSGMRDQNLQLRCRLKDFKGYVRVRPGWESWSEDRTLNIAASMVAPRFALQLPIHVRQERCLIDDFRIFIPLEALALETLENLLALEIEILDQTGERLASVEERVNLRAVQARPDRLSLPAPQAVRFTEHDYANGSYLRALTLQRVYRQQSGQVYEALRFGLDLCMAGAAQEIFTLNCRILDRDLLAAGGSDLGVSSSFLVQGSVRSYNGYALELPLSGLPPELQLTESYAELTLCRPDGRIVCGVVVPCSALHGDVQVAIESFGALLEWDSPQIEGMEVEPAVEWKGEQCVCATLAFSGLNAEGYCVLFEFRLSEPGLESRGAVRRLYGLRAEQDQELLCRVRAAELASLVPGEPSAKAAFLLRASLISPSDRIIASHTRHFTLALAAVPKSGRSSAPPAVEIVGLRSFLAAGGAPAFEARLDIEALPEHAHGLMLYYELVDRAGRSVTIEQGVPCLDGVLPGGFVEIAASQMPSTELVALGLRQLAFEFEPLKARHAGTGLLSDFSVLRLFVFSRQGQLLDRLSFSLHSELEALAESVQRGNFLARVARVFGVGLS